ncbi:MAG TPA: TIGR04282 family arsenosugar biosynthesis glycosyltransferase [Terriglobia bacterium]|nr:TIGR04282 family arsenosugar biosynthesis glycosyltransferase [Terriglobia bacterium]
MPNALRKSGGEFHAPSAALVIFARLPRAGFAKTRLIPLLGAKGAAELQQALLTDALAKLKTLRGEATLYLMKTGRAADGADSLASAGKHVRILPQRGKDLGERLDRAFGFLLRRHQGAVVMGTDSPGLSAQILVQALEELRWCESVLGPCPDGGYYLIGLRRGAGGIRRNGLLKNVRWGTHWALQDTLRNLLSCGVSCSLLPPLADVDRPEDFMALRNRMRENRGARRLAPAAWRFVSAFSIAAAKKAKR